MGHSLIIRHLCPPPTVVSVCSPNQPPSQSGRTDCLHSFAFNSVSFCCGSLAGVWEEIHVPSIFVIVMMKAHCEHFQHVSFLYELASSLCLNTAAEIYQISPKSLWFHSLLSLLHAILLAPVSTCVNVSKPLEGFGQVGRLSLNIFVLLDLSDFSRYIRTLRFV